MSNVQCPKNFLRNLCTNSLEFYINGEENLLNPLFTTILYANDNSYALVYPKFLPSDETLLS